MKILVCVSVVPDTTTKITFNDNDTTFNKTGVQFIINPYDELALTRAIEIAEQNSGSVDVITVGEVDCDPIIRKALAMGANEAFRINAHPVNSMFVAQQIANHAKNNSYDLILTGRESIDYNGGMVGGLLAVRMGIPYVPNCVHLDLSGDEVALEREIDGGKERLKASLPLIIGAQKGLVEEKDLIIPNMRGIMQARQKPLEVVSPIEITAATLVEHYEKPPEKGAVKLVDAEDIDGLIDLLTNEAKVL